jgi:hypothetical protein
MLVLFLILLVLLVLTGSLLTVLKVAVGVALGLFGAIVLLGALGAWWIRRRWRRALEDVRSRSTVGGSSTVEVLPGRGPRAAEMPRDLTQSDDGVWSAGDHDPPAVP